jgi:hypothetical protein
MGAGARQEHCGFLSSIATGILCVYLSERYQAIDVGTEQTQLFTFAVAAALGRAFPLTSVLISDLATFFIVASPLP